MRLIFFLQKYFLLFCNNFLIFLVLKQRFTIFPGIRLVLSIQKRIVIILLKFTKILYFKRFILNIHKLYLVYKINTIRSFFYVYLSSRFIYMLFSSFSSFEYIYSCSLSVIYFVNLSFFEVFFTNIYRLLYIYLSSEINFFFLINRLFSYYYTFYYFIFHIFFIIFVSFFSIFILTIIYEQIF